MQGKWRLFLPPQTFSALRRQTPRLHLRTLQTPSNAAIVDTHTWNTFLPRHIGDTVPSGQCFTAQRKFSSTFTFTLSYPCCCRPLVHLCTHLVPGPDLPGPLPSFTVSRHQGDGLLLRGSKTLLCTVAVPQIEPLGTIGSVFVCISILGEVKD